MGVAAIVTVISWVWASNICVWALGLALLSWTGGKQLVALDCWRADLFGAGFWYGSLLLGLISVLVASQIARRVQAGNSWIAWWLGAGGLWLLVAGAWSAAAFVLDYLGILDGWKPTGPVIAWLGWAFLFPAWSLWMHFRVFTWLWRNTIRDRWAGMLLIAVALSGAGVLPASLSEKEVAANKSTEIKIERLIDQAAKWLGKKWPLAYALGGDVDQMNLFAQLARTSMLLGQTSHLESPDLAAPVFSAPAPTVRRGIRPTTQSYLPSPAPAIAVRPRGYVLALSWLPQFCETGGQHLDPEQCKDRKNAFVVHGLWPYKARGRSIHCSGGLEFDALYAASADAVMPSRRSARHQWRKHGRCLGWSQRRYFKLTRQLLKQVRPPMLGNTRPGLSWKRLAHANPYWMTYKADGRVNLLERRIVYRCSETALDEAWLCFDPAGDPTDCPRQLKTTCATRALIRGFSRL